jgi:hypothetical protein
MSPEEAATQNSSLFLIQPENFAVEVSSSTWNGKTKRIYRGNFIYNQTYYSLSLTDPAARNVFKNENEGQYPIEKVYLCVSLTEPFDDGRCHKLVAAIITNPRL